MADSTTENLTDIATASGLQTTDLFYVFRPGSPDLDFRADGADVVTLVEGNASISTLAAGAVDAITEIDAALKSGADTTLITGTAGTANNLALWNADGDLVDASVSVADLQQTDEEIQDVVGAMLTGNTETLITVTYQDADGTIDFVVDNDLNNYSNATSGFITAASTTTLTNKTFDANGTGNSLSNVETADIASGSKSGSDATLITGTAGTNNYLAKWNADGDLVDGHALTGADAAVVSGTAGSADDIAKWNGDGDLVAAVAADIKGTESIIIACSDETTALTTGTGKVTFRMPYAFTVTGVRASVTTAPTGSVLTVDINEGGTSILSTKLTIDATEKTSETAATAAVISDSSLADDAEITIDIDGIGSTVAGAGLKVTLIGNRT